MATGQVKWFNNAKGYGFIRPDQDGPDLFVHYSYINMGGYKTLKAGQAVSFDIKTVDSGAHAVNLNLQEAIGLQHAAATPTTQTVPQSS